MIIGYCLMSLPSPLHYYESFCFFCIWNGVSWLLLKFTLIWMFPVLSIFFARTKTWNSNGAFKIFNTWQVKKYWEYRNVDINRIRHKEPAGWLCSYKLIGFCLILDAYAICIFGSDSYAYDLRDVVPVQSEAYIGLILPITS